MSENKEFAEIGSIEVGTRFRLDLGDVQSLADSIDEIGLLQPIGVTPDMRLVFGQRRLEAFKLLGKSEIPIRVVDVPRIIDCEHAENAIRKDFSMSERVAIGEALEAEIGNRQGERTDVEPAQDIGQVGRGKTADVAAKSSGFGNPETYRQAKTLVSDAPELAEAVDRGEKTVGGAFTELKRKKKEEKREKRRSENAEKVAAAPSPEQSGAKYATILIDPPWDWGDEGDCDQMGRAKPTYQTIPYAKLLGLPVAELADEDCHLYLWTTNRSLPKCFPMMEKWGFRYITMLSWPKPSFGMGNYFRGQTEHVLFGVKGSQPLKRKDASTLLPTWNRGVQGHSSKPEEFYEFIESCSPGPFLELFARNRHEGWIAWGAEV